MFETVMASKSLSANINKTGYLHSGKKKNVEKSGKKTTKVLSYSIDHQ